MDAKLELGSGRIVKKGDSDNLYFDFKYYGKRVEISSGREDSPENRELAMSTFAGFRDKNSQGTFRFGEAFPGASPKLKAFFAAKEATAIIAPEDVNLGEYVPTWYRDVWALLGSESKKYDYKIAIDLWIVPFFGGMSFFDLNSSAVGKFIHSLRHKRGEHAGKPLSGGRIRHILAALRAIWKDAAEKYRWELPDPFQDVPEQMPEIVSVDECKNNAGGTPKKVVEPRVPLRFNDFMAYLGKIDEWYRPVAELWMLTGIIPTEMAGLARSDIQDGYLYVHRSTFRGVATEKEEAKYRSRRVRITVAIQKVLDIFLARAGGSGRLITLKGGKPFTHCAFSEAWLNAEEAAQLPHRVPGVLRHSFAVWALSIGIDKNRLVSLLGHGSKRTVYVEYSKYVEILRHDRKQILDYFGEDFVAAELRTGAKR